MRKIIIIVTGVLILLAVNFTIYQRQELRNNGRIIYLELVPVDPRSLMQGDYMALNYKIANDAFGFGRISEGKDGYLIAELNEKNIASFKRLDNKESLAKNEILLRYRVREERVKFATNAYFFEEGQAEKFEKAKYGEFRVSDNGELLLMQLRDKDLAVLGK
ncbi:hypothetical protein DOJK_01082 [Patescibacteria group bacterium]|nr:hypothetical protein DOJK_01082 [Patescibacteria group bacterium]